MRFNNGFNVQDTDRKFYSSYPDSAAFRRLRRKRSTLRTQPATFYNTNLGASSGVGSYNDNEEMDFSGMGEGTDQSQIKSVAWYDQVGKAVSSVLTPENVKAVAAYKLEKAKNKINLERAKQGLPPVDLATATVGLSGDTKKFLLYGALGLGALFILPKLLRG